MYFWTKFAGIAKMFLSQKLERTGMHLRAQRYQLETLGCWTRLAAPRSPQLPPPPAEMLRGPRSGHGWDRAPGPVQKQWGPG